MLNWPTPEQVAPMLSGRAYYPDPLTRRLAELEETFKKGWALLALLTEADPLPDSERLFQHLVRISEPTELGRTIPVRALAFSAPR